MDFEWLFGSILDALWGPFCIKNQFWKEKGDFVKMSVSRKRELYFVGYGVPETLQKASQKRLEKV